MRVGFSQQRFPLNLPARPEDNFDATNHFSQPAAVCSDHRILRWRMPALSAGNRLLSPIERGWFRPLGRCRSGWGMSIAGRVGKGPRSRAFSRADSGRPGAFRRQRLHRSMGSYPGLSVAGQDRAVAAIAMGAGTGLPRVPPYSADCATRASALGYTTPHARLSIEKYRQSEAADHNHRKRHSQPWVPRRCDFFLRHPSIDDEPAAR